MPHPNNLDGPKLAVVVAAAGSSRRFGSDKLSASIGGRTVLESSIEHLRAALPGVPVLVVVGEADLDRWCSTLEDVEVIAGGDRRQDSVRLGVERAAAAGAELVVVHDGARPAVNPDDVRRLLSALEDADGAILCSRPADTVKSVDDTGVVIETFDRRALRLAQTPQLVRVAALEQAWRVQGRKPEWSDESALLEACGFEVRAIEAAHPNPKLTAPSDLELVRLLLEHR